MAHREPLPVQVEQAINQIVDDARAPVMAEVVDATQGWDPTRIEAATALWHQVEGEGYRPATNHQGARRTWLAGRIAAHLIAATAPDHEDDADPIARAAWAQMAASRGAIDQTDWVERTQARLDLTRTWHPDDTPHAPEGVRLVASWLAHTTGRPLVRATGLLCDSALAQNPTPAAYRDAWYATCGRDLLDLLRATYPPVRGRQDETGRTRLSLLRVAAIGYLRTYPSTPERELMALTGAGRTQVVAWRTEAHS